MTGLYHAADALRVTWSDGLASEHHVLLLRENSPDATTIHPTVREMCVAPTDIAADVAISSATA